MNTQQEAMYSTCVEALVNGSLECYSATVLAYGQGKSGIKIHEDASRGMYVMGATMKPIL